ncbi:MAG: efflux RND transporter periplasmic adaptor subunit [Candidatus Aminicenantes bacterium]|nr:efflux RND transporter periplasmic adaptor subunit [Candidatus Aminicenantes bacterium]
MKTKIIFILFIGILIGAAATYLVLPNLTSGESLAQDSEKQLYSCGMHPEVISDKPGNCPICGMKLPPIKGSAQATGQATAEAAEKERKVLYWQAPMDPTEIYDQPGKSKMGMDLVPVYEGEEAGGAGSIMIDGTLQQNMNLRVADVEQRDMSNVIRVYGRVTYAQDKEYSVNTKISGWVEKLYVNTLGQKVRKGQTLLEIYSPELVSTQEEYLLALKNYEKLSDSPYESIRKNAERMLVLAQRRLEFWDISTVEIEKIKTTGKARRSFPLNSRISGVVTHKTVKEGDKIGPGMELFHIADLSKVWVEASVYEGDLASINEGQRAELELDQIQGFQLEGKVDFIYPYLDQKSRANNIRLVFDNPGQILKPEMYATVRIFNKLAEKAMAIPAEAVIHSGKRKIVFVTKGDGKFEPREVKLGTESDDGYVEIVSGLFLDEKIVVSGQFLLDSESQTREAIAKMRARQKQSTNSDSHEGQTESEMPAVIEHSYEEHQHDMVSISADKLFACPMHPEFITSDPNAKCPECGMDVVPAKELGDKLKLEEAEFYTCSMHPEFITTDPDAQCPECGMKLEKVKKK